MPSGCRTLVLRLYLRNLIVDELVHFSGHPKRLDRQLKTRFVTRGYAAEELVAELGAAFLRAHLGVQGQLRHADYIRQLA
jgi:antirestriction protein ArdC